MKTRVCIGRYVTTFLLLFYFFFYLISSIHYNINNNIITEHPLSSTLFFWAINGYVSMWYYVWINRKHMINYLNYSIKTINFECMHDWIVGLACQIKSNLVLHIMFFICSWIFFVLFYISCMCLLRHGIVRSNFQTSLSLSHILCPYISIINLTWFIYNMQME